MPADGPRPTPTTPPDRAAPAGAGALVAAVHRDDHLAAVDVALERLGALGVAGGDTVVLKVNTNSGDPAPYSSSPALVAHLTRRLRARGAEVLVGDRSFWGDPDTAGNLERNGIAGAARAAGARVVVFDDRVEWVEVDPALVPSWRPPVRVPRLCREAEHVVNLACLKTHFITGATLSLKNLLGLVHAEDRARPGNLRSHHPDRIHAQVAEVHRAVKASLHLCDGFDALVGGGPTPASGTPVVARVRTVIASADPVAADAVALAVLRAHAAPGEAVREAPPWQSPILAAAVAAGVGARGPEEVQLWTSGAVSLSS